MVKNTDNLFQPHGGDIFQAADFCGCLPEEIIDFSANINPYGPPIGLNSALTENLLKIAHYPEPYSKSLIEEASRFFQVPSEMIIAANGATEILDIIPRIFVREQALISVPAYAGYLESIRKNNLSVKYVSCSDPQDILSTTTENITQALDSKSIIFLGRPGNPAGDIVDVGFLKSLITDNPESFFVIDESFLDFVPQEKSLVYTGFENLLIVRSLTKIYTIPGLRLGLAMGHPQIMNRLRQFLSPWSVNSLAQAAGTYCLQQKDFIKDSISKISLSKQALVKCLKQIPWIKVFKGHGNFLLCRIRDSRFTAHELCLKLLSQKILIRPASNFYGLDKYFFRIAVKNDADNHYLYSSLKSIENGTVRSAPSRISRPPTPAIMFQGTCSGAGKSLMAAALCRILHQDGIKVAPFKSQNMSLNSYVTREGHEMGRAQVVQSIACGLEPDSRMNPVLLKPCSETGSQVIVQGISQGNMEINDYIRYKKGLFNRVQNIYDEFSADYQVMVLEGAGSPAEINLKEHDIVNMRMARHADAKVILVGDIDRGGVFASFLGTYQMLLPWEKDLLSGMIINKFRGQEELLQSAIDYTSRKTGKEFFGVVPFLNNLKIPEEDSVAFKNHSSSLQPQSCNCLHIGLIDLPHISNFTDFDPLSAEPDVTMTIVRNPADFRKDFDIVIVPGSKSVISDLNALKASGLDRQIQEFANHPGKEVIGICGGFQMFGSGISDPYALESEIDFTKGLGLLPLETVIKEHKILKQVSLPWNDGSGNSLYVKGYEIHHGRTTITGPVHQPIKNPDGEILSAAHVSLHVWGTYIHGVFDDDQLRRHLLNRVRIRKGLQPLEGVQSYYDVDQALDDLALAVRRSVDIKGLYSLLGIGY
ncbi:MAG: cobyric acid synthase [Desulfonatronovibrio sp.]